MSLSGSFKILRWHGPKALLNQRIVRIIPKKERVTKDYLYYYISSKISDIQRKAQGVAVANASMGAVRNMQILLPPLSEQERIVEILDKADTLRKKRQEADELSGRMMSAIFCDMFNNYLYGKKSTGIMLGEVIRIKRPLVDPRKKEFQHLPHINGEIIESKAGKLLKYNTVAEEKLISSKFAFEKGDVLYNKIRPYLCKATIPRFRGLCSADMYPITPKTDLILPEYLLWFLLSDKFTKYAVQCSTRARMPKLNRAELFGFRTSLPSLSEQQKFADLVQEVEKIKKKQQKSEQELDNVFNSLMQRMFEG